MRFRRFAFTTLIGFLFLSAKAFAALEFAPELRTEMDLAKRMAYIFKLLPETLNGPESSWRVDSAKLSALLMDEQKTIHELNGDLGFMQAAAERPPLKIVRMQRVVETEAQEKDLNSKWVDLLQMRTDVRWSYTEAARNELRARLENLDARSSASFFSGLAKILKGRGREGLGEPDLKTRWAKIRPILKQELNAQELHAFRAKEYGIFNEDWQLEDLDRAVDQLQLEEEKLLALIQFLAPPGTPPDEGWILTEDVSRWLYREKLSPQILRKLSILQSRAVKLYTDNKAGARKTEVQHELVLRELAPWEAIYRGAIGGDCSTNNSWAYVYSPYERDWWIENREGIRIGYVTGTMTVVNGEPNLYIRDVRMAKTEFPGAATLILSGFFKILESYGAKSMTIMPIIFLNQNKNTTDRAELLSFMAGEKLIPVYQEFPDRRWREGVLARASRGMGTSYDSADVHKEVRLVKEENVNLDGVRVQILEDDAPRRAYSKDDPQTLWNVLTTVLNTGSKMPPSDTERTVDWASIVEVLRNKERLGVDAFFALADQVFTRNGFEVSRNLMRKHEDIFVKGFLEAFDAFDEKHRRQGVRFVIDLLLRRASERDIDRATETIADHLEVFKTNDSFARSVVSIFKRRTEQDRYRARKLLEVGYHFENAEITGEDWRWMAFSALDKNTRLVAIQKYLELSQASEAADAQLQLLLITMLRHNPGDIFGSQQAAELLSRFNGLKVLLDDTGHAAALSTISDCMKSGANKPLRSSVALAYLRGVSEVRGDIQTRALAIVREITESESPTSERFLAARKILDAIAAHACEKDLNPTGSD